MTAEPRVLAMQTKLHRWAVSDPDRRFDDVGNLVYDPAFLVVAWSGVRVNKGARTAGVDGIVPAKIADPAGWLDGVRETSKPHRFRPDQVREVMIPKRNGKLRRLGIPTAQDRVVQASLKLVKLLPPRRVQEHLQLPRSLHVVEDRSLGKQHVGLNWQTIRRRYLPSWVIRDGRYELHRAAAETVSRYRYRGPQIPTPWQATAHPMESRMR
jgi:hypothetical protein